ncbi:MAG: metal-dependent hydrolase [Chloroflexota bacterium]
MQTYSHFIITAALNHKYKDKSKVKVDTWALLLGSVAPDIPLVILTAIFFFQRFVLEDGTPVEGLFGAEYDNLYFNDPLWITGHALFHAPPMLIFYLTIGYIFGFRGGKTWARALFWFAIGASLHSAIDIVTHHNDGPLLFFPFNWDIRFISPISYWDPNHYGNIFAPIEHVFDLIVVIWLFVSRRKRKKQDNS